MQLALGQPNTCVATVQAVAVALALRAPNGAPLRHRACKVRYAGAVVVEATTTEDGILRTTVPVTVREVGIGIPSLLSTMTVQDLAINPIGTDSGVEARLRNLGFYTIESFQREHGLSVTGEARRRHPEQAPTCPWLLMLEHAEGEA